MENELNKEPKKQKSDKSVLKNLIIGAVILLIIVTGFIILLNKDSQINELYLETQRLDNIIEQRDSVVNELDGAISEIEQNISFIKTKREQLEFEYRESSKDRKEQIIEDIALMNTMLEESEQKMEELESRLQSASVEIRSFRNRVTVLSNEIKNQTKIIANLKKDVDERDARIANMNEKVNELETELVVRNDSLAALSDSINKSNQILRQLDQDLHKAYWALGTFKELKENNVLERDGGFLGLGKNKILKRDFNESYFTELDIRQTDSIPLNAKKAEVISDHVPTSYRLVYQDDLAAYLKIENPEEFWKKTKYAVIEVKQ